ncbi:hypothetical protein Tco_1111169 [Tanacetum coccineum]|uniref:Retrotransposon gag domain-containing protein n=1 Tax=Tanacetum coccineum TaxID=301880 RepID=A0ABQ5IM48_9ASTR
MLIALSAKNKLKLVNGEYEELDSSSDLTAYWERANDMLISWILNIVSEQIDRHRIYQLMNEIVDLKQSNCTIKIYYHKLKGLWDELDAIEAPYACTFKCICVNVKENGEREHMKRNTNPINPIQPNTQIDRRNTFRKGVFCGYCKKEGYSKEECFKLLGYPVGHPLHKKYLPPSQRTQSNNRPRIVNMVTGETSNSGDPITSQSTPQKSPTSAALNEALDLWLGWM